MVARILVGTTVSIITRMDSPKWFKENAEPHVFSQARYDKVVEELKGMGREDSNAAQALVRDAERFTGGGGQGAQLATGKERAMGSRGG